MTALCTWFGAVATLNSAAFKRFNRLHKPESDCKCAFVIRLESIKNGLNLMNFLIVCTLDIVHSKISGLFALFSFIEIELFWVVTL